MSTTGRSIGIRLLLATLALAPCMALAAAGEFTFVVGEVTLTKGNGQRSTPVRGTPVDAGDRITTGANGMAQLTMVDQARLSLRPATQFQIEAYPDRRDSNEGAILSLLRGTLRTFTGLIASANRDKYVMKTRVATVGIRGSGNILYACEGADCDESVAPGNQQGSGVTVNYTIEGSHASPASPRPGAHHAHYGTGQTVLVPGTEAPRYIPTPRFIADLATNMTGARGAAAAPASGASAETRNFSPSDTPALPPAQQTNTPLVGNNGLGFPTVDASSNVFSTRCSYRTASSRRGLRCTGRRPPASSATGTSAATSRTPAAASRRRSRAARLTDNGTVVPVIMGRYENAGLGFFGPGTGSGVPGSVHWIMAPSGYPTYLSDVLTGSATYTLVAATSPTNQNNTGGAFSQATLVANFSNRTLGVDFTVTVPAAGSNAGGQWHVAANAVPFSLNSFFASTGDYLTIANGSTNSTANPNLTASIEGSFVGAGLGGAILGYGITDRTSSTAANWNTVSGVAAFGGAALDATAPFREGRISDPNDTLLSFIRTYSTTNRPDEVTTDAQGRVTAFSAPFQGLGSHASYALGSAQVVQSGFDPTTGCCGPLGWGHGDYHAVARRPELQPEPAARACTMCSRHRSRDPLRCCSSGVACMMCSARRARRVSGAVGTLGTATLDANFTNRTVAANVSIAIANQT
jgi:hypothetical protein